eukprot:3665601-Pyramimonas_sp.AAC.1
MREPTSSWALLELLNKAKAPAQDSHEQGSSKWDARDPLRAWQARAGISLDAFGGSFWKAFGVSRG